MRLNKALAQTGLTVLLALVFMMTSVEAEAKRNRNRSQRQKHQQCQEILTGEQFNLYFERNTSSNYQSRNNRGNRRYDNRDYRQQNQERYRERPAQGRDTGASFGDIRDQLFAEISRAHTRSISYGDARERIMHTLDMRQDARGTYVWDYYCQRAFRISPSEMPNSTELNVEHTWPQSRFSTRFPRDQQKTDLHHLFPTDSWANQLRGHMTFGLVVRDTRYTDANCKESRVGYNSNNQERFLPPVHHRGAVARALFYFAVRYKLSIDAEEEAILRQWHKDDPVSEEDMERNNKIEKIQGNRNPFVDRPELVDQIPTFR